MEQRTGKARAWTPEAIVAAIQRYHAETGMWPLQVDFCNANGLPGAYTVEWHFESLAAARRQAGMPNDGWHARRRKAQRAGQ